MTTLVLFALLYAVTKFFSVKMSWISTALETLSTAVLSALNYALAFFLCVKSSKVSWVALLTNVMLMILFLDCFVDGQFWNAVVIVILYSVRCETVASNSRTLESLEQNTDALRAGVLQSLREQYEEAIAQSKSTLEKGNLDVGVGPSVDWSLERALEAKTKELEDSERQVEKWKAALSRAQVEHDALLKKHERLSREHSDSNMLLENEKASRATLKRTKRELEQEVDDLQNKVRQLEHAVDSLEKEKVQLDEDLYTEQEKCILLQDALEDVFMKRDKVIGCPAA